MSLGLFLAASVLMFLVVTVLTVVSHTSTLRRVIRHYKAKSLPRLCLALVWWLIRTLLNLDASPRFVKKTKRSCWRNRFGTEQKFVRTVDPSGIATHSHMIADPRKSNALGEDAFFIEGTWAGVADGVGGWRSQGVDPGRFSRALTQMIREMIVELSHTCGVSVKVCESDTKPDVESLKQNEALNNNSQGTKETTPKVDDLIRKAFLQVVSNEQKSFSTALHSLKKKSGSAMERVRESVIQGSSTILVYHLDVKRKVLYCGNVGDCELIVLRRLQPSKNGVQNEKESPSTNSADDSSVSEEAPVYGIVDRIIPGCFSFNMPHQIGMQIVGNSLDIIDCPSIAVQRIKVQAGDIIICGSDGLFDNVFDEEILEIASSFVNSSVDHSTPLEKANWEKLARTLAKLAIRYGKDRRYMSPFAVKASEVSGSKMRGGKLDDTTVLVSYIH